MDPAKEKKYLLVTLEFPPVKGGVATLYRNYVDGWPAGRLYVLANDVLGVDDRDSIKYRKLLGKAIWPHWLPAFFAIRSAIKELGGNTHVIVGQILPLGIVVYCLSKLLKFKYTVLLHGMDFTLATISARKKSITEKIMLNAETIVCSNSYTANSVKAFNPLLASKMAMVNPGIESSFVRNPERVIELRQKYNIGNQTVLLGLGRLVRRKGVDKVIESMQLILKSAPDTVYVIAGAGPDADSFKKMASALPEEVRKKIIFLGQISNEDQWAWLELCDIFIMVSRNIAGDYEGFGQVYLEANLAAKPVIAGDSGGVRDAVINNINGLLVDPEKPEDIAAAVIRLINDPILRQELGEQGKRRVVENFNSRKLVAKLYNFINNQNKII
jgi:phosphatidyl-myo-inositol dimannoside synthase